LPYIAVEDGFLRSLDLGCRGAAPLSLVVDRTGIYYDATCPSDLENILNSDGWQTDGLMERARAAMQAIVRHDLSKYNAAPQAPERLRQGPEAPEVLVIDQTFGDASVSLGLADAQTFELMLAEALEQHPGKRVCVKTHPDVLAGKKSGYLTKLAKQRNVPLIAENCSPLSLMENVGHVYTVTSQMGFEALLLGKEVHCFGLPFYAGWGATKDRVSCPRRAKIRSVEEIFAAAYLLYARYVNPVTGRRCDLEDTISLLAEQRRQSQRNRTISYCAGFRWWKKPYARAYLGCADKDLQFFGKFDTALIQACGPRDKGELPHEVVCWSSHLTGSEAERCEKAGVTLTRMEDGFIRSSGLGSEFNWPYSLVMDRKGIYYDPEGPSDLEDILNALPSHPDHDRLVERARALRAFILENQLTKYNLNDSHLPDPDLPRHRKVILVPGQVEDDASVRRGGCGLTNLTLLQAVREANPLAYIIYKPHPDVLAGARKGSIAPEDLRPLANLVLEDFPMGRLLPLVNEVHAMTSQTGFEALLRGVGVTTYGGPFYAGWGLTEDRQSFPRRTARLTLDELVAGALLLYPTYYDWQTAGFCRCEDVCERLLQPDGQRKGRVWARLAGAWKKTVNSMR
ncbi:MAG: capsular polysaccharide biosynthesis protein, partial [Desulfovibrionaceae bacterium]|nr:capsular polysaccharide biosynthesis protein [Desulfovibrionaceae bacterium]